ncbi:MAG: hypothetical protein GXO61_01905 [Epsilonproteobacteria bacterium]|nr:hypothetical protein [Campylobacterota bacterium]
MKKVVLAAVFTTILANALELRVSDSTFNFDFSLQHLLSGDMDIDTKTLLLQETHKNLFDSNYFYAFDLSLYKSDRVDKLTTFFTRPLTQEWPFFGSISQAIDEYTPLPVPVDYKVRGIDFNLQLGYDIAKTPKGYFGLAVTTGISVPFVKMYDLQKAIKLTLAALDTTKTKIKTYKLGVGFNTAYEVYDSIWLYSLGSINFQTGSIENSLVKSSFDADGTNYNLDIGMRYELKQILDNLFLSVGYAFRSWDVDEVSVELIDSLNLNFSPLFSSKMEMEQFYVGIGYNF